MTLTYPLDAPWVVAFIISLITSMVFWNAKDEFTARWFFGYGLFWLFIMPIVQWTL